MKKRLFVILAALALLCSFAVFSVSADGEDVRSTFVCPCSTCTEIRKTNPSYTCPETSAWKSVSTKAATTFEDGGHYYVGTDTTVGGQLITPAGAEVVLLVDNCTLRYQGEYRMFVMNGSNDSTEQSMQLHMIGNNNANVQSKYTGSSIEGLVIQVGAYDIAHLHLYGDLTVSCEEGSASATNGSIAKLPSKGRMYIHDNANMGLSNGDDPVLVGHTATGNGGTVYLQNGSPQFTMEAGTIQGGTAVNGGAIYVGNGKVTVSGTAQITGGEATDGGAIYINAGTVELNAGNITGNEATHYGGGIYAAGGKVKIGGDTANYPNGPTISGCHAASRGGGVYVVATGNVEMAGGSISGCYVGSSGVGGAVYVRGESDGTRGTFAMSGGTITVDGSKTGNSKGVRVQGGNLNLSGTATIVSAGAGETGSGIDCLGGKVSLDGQAQVYTPAGKTAYDILVRNSGTPTLTVNSTWTGSATVRYNKIVDDKSYAPGGVIDSKYAVSTGDYSGQLYLQSESTLPRIYGKDGKLVFSDVAVVDANGMTWQKNNAEALTTCNNADNKYIKLFNTALAMNGETVYVDFNGLTVDVSGSGTVYGFDSSAGTDGEGTAAVTATGVTVETFVTDPVGCESFIAVVEDGTATFHVIKPVIDSISLRPGNAGMYYSGKVICDDTLASYITAYGIALSLDKMPDQNFKSDSLYTQESKSLVPGGSFNGVLVSDIMKAGADNNARAEMIVYGNAYVTVVVNGQTITYLSSDSGNAASMNLKTLVSKVNAIYRTLNTKQQTAMNGLYNNFKSDMADTSWHINNIAAGAGGDVVANDQDGLKVLMIGNSLSVDAGRMLAYVFALEGYDNVRISTLYKSGCKLWEHADFIATGEAAYTFYNSQYTDAAAAVADPASVKPKTTSSKTILYGIQQEDWDIIVMQQGSAQAALAETYNEDIQTIIDYVLENDINPETKPAFVWNSIWGYPYNADELATNGADYVTLLKRNTGSDTADAATQIKMVDMITQAAKNKIMTNDQFAYVIPTGTAFIHGCAALSNEVMYYDYIHASDLGRLMVSYMWYSAITGNAVEDLPDTIPGVLRRTETTDRVVTAAEEAVLLGCISKAFAEPYTMPTGFAN